MTHWEQYKSHCGWVFAAFLFIYHYATIVELKERSVLAYQKMVFTEIEQMKQLTRLDLNKINKSETEDYYRDHCQPVDKVVFLKTHKTGSETLAGILRKYSMLNNMSTLLSTNNGGHLYHSGKSKHAPIDDTLLMEGYGQPGAHFEFIATHMTWNKSFVDATIKQPRKTITLLRDPTTLMESTWKYYYTVFKNPTWIKYATASERTSQLYALLENPSKFYNETLAMGSNAYRYVLRSQLASFGFGNDVYKRNIDRELVTKWIGTIAIQFDLVLIMEYFDYSLALLAIELCWPLMDLANLMTNVGKRVKVAKKMYYEELIHVINYPDYMLYDHFNQTLWRKIDQIGLDKVHAMSVEIGRLSKQLENECVNGYVPIKLWNGRVDNEAVVPPDKSNNLTCLATVKWGSRQTELLREKQHELMEREQWNS